MSGRRPYMSMYTSYVRTVINGLIARFPDLEVPLQAIVERLVDLHSPTQQVLLPSGNGRVVVIEGCPAHDSTGHAVL